MDSKDNDLPPGELGQRADVEFTRDPVHCGILTLGRAVTHDSDWWRAEGRVLEVGGSDRPITGLAD